MKRYDTEQYKISGLPEQIEFSKSQNALMNNIEIFFIWLKQA
jgi:hypothetical protein